MAGEENAHWTPEIERRPRRQAQSGTDSHWWNTGFNDGASSGEADFVDNEAVFLHADGDARAQANAIVNAAIRETRDEVHGLTLGDTGNMSTADANEYLYGWMEGYVAEILKRRDAALQ